MGPGVSLGSVNRRDQPEIPQDLEYDDEFEPRVARTELRETALAVVVTVGLAALVLAVALMSSGGLKTVLILVAPSVVAIGALIVAVRAYRCYRAGGRWQIWQGGMWLLMMIYLTWMFGAVPAVLN